MENKAHALAAGTFVLVVASLLVALAVWLTRDTGEHVVYEMSTRDAVSGLQSQAPVRFRGVDVGKVTDIGFDTKVPGNVLVRIEVDKLAPMTRGTFATLGFQGVTGLAFIALDDAGDNPVALVAQGDQPPRIPLRPGLLAKLSDRGEAILLQVEQVSKRVNELLAPDNQKALVGAMDKIGDAATTVGQLAARLNKTVTAGVDPTLAETRETLRSLQTASGEIARTSAEFATTARRLNEKGGPIDRLADGAQTLSFAAETFGAATLPRVNKVSEDTSRAMRRLSRTVNAINDNPQSLIFGNGSSAPGPGEQGFVPPGVAP